jgi:predicted dehydrogenase
MYYKLLNNFVSGIRNQAYDIRWLFHHSPKHLKRVVAMPIQESNHKKMNKVRFGVIGLGNMGGGSRTNILEGKITRAVLGAVCDVNPEAASRFPDIPVFTDSAALIASGAVDAVLITTPHFSHTTIGIAVLQAGLHLLVEKLISVHKADCERLIAQAAKSSPPCLTSGQILFMPSFAS